MSNTIRPGRTVGADAGATLCKLVLPAETELRAVKFPSGDMAALRGFLDEWKPERLVATGGGAARLVREITGLPVHAVPEFEAWARGGPLLAARVGLQLPDSYLLAAVGTGTSVLLLAPDGAKRI